MRSAALSLPLLALAAFHQAHAQALTVGLSAPLNGPFAALGQQWTEGVRAAATLEGDEIRLVEADDGCTEEGGEAAARQLIEAGATIVIGFLCTPSIDAAMPLFERAGIPVITPVRTGSLTDQKTRTGWPVYRLGPRGVREREAVAEILVERWRDAFFAIVDEGTLYGRELAEYLRAEAELAGLKPVFVDTFRPQLDNQIGLVGRLRRAGATHVFVGGDRGDIAIMARDAENLGYDVTFAGGETLRAEDGPLPLPADVLMVGLPEWQEIAAPQALEALRQARLVPEGYVLLGFAGLELAARAARMAASDSVTIEDALSRYSFETAIGEVRFDAKGDLTRNLYRLFRYDGEKFVEWD